MASFGTWVFSWRTLCLYCKPWLCISQSIVEYISMFCRHVLLSVVPNERHVSVTNCNMFLFKVVNLWMKLYRLYFHVPTSWKGNFVGIEDLILQHLSGVPDLLSKTSMEIVKFSFYFLDEYTVTHFQSCISFLPKVCMCDVLVHTLWWWLYCLPFV